METGAIVAVTTHSGAAADPTTVKETVMEAGIAVAGWIAEKTPEGGYEVHPEGVKEVVADKGYHVAEPDRGPRNWDGKQAEKQAVHGNRRRVQGERGKRLQRQPGERIIWASRWCPRTTTIRHGGRRPGTRHSRRSPKQRITSAMAARSGWSVSECETGTP